MKMVTKTSTLSVVAVGAHPDDIEFNAAGLMKLLAGKGHSLHFVTMTAGDMGSSRTMGEDIAARRFGEAQKSAKRFNATYDCIGQRDFAIGQLPGSVKEVVRVIRKYEANILLTHPRKGYMKDHEKTHDVVRDAAIRSPVPRYCRMEVKSGNFPPELESIPFLYYWSPHGGLDCEGEVFPAHFLVLLGEEEIEAKKKALECHSSQREWLKRHYGTDEYIDMMVREAGLWLTQFNLQDETEAEYAEPFIQDLSAGFPRKDIIKEILEDRVLATDNYRSAWKSLDADNLFLRGE